MFLCSYHISVPPNFQYLDDLCHISNGKVPPDIQYFGGEIVLNSIFRFCNGFYLLCQNIIYGTRFSVAPHSENFIQRFIRNSLIWLFNFLTNSNSCDRTLSNTSTLSCSPHIRLIFKRKCIIFGNWRSYFRLHPLSECLYSCVRQVYL